MRRLRLETLVHTLCSRLLLVTSKCPPGSDTQRIRNVDLAQDIYPQQTAHKPMLSTLGAGHLSASAVEYDHRRTIFLRTGSLGDKRSTRRVLGVKVHLFNSCTVCTTLPGCCVFTKQRGHHWRITCSASRIHTRSSLL